MGLERYRHRRHFSQTPEPRADAGDVMGRRFVVQRHAARRLHYDLRLELNGVLKSWAIPKGPTLKPAEKRLAVHVEDHPLAYGDFEGVIPPAQYGAGSVLVWDRGIWIPAGDPEADYRQGHLRFFLLGSKLRGRWDLIRMRGGEAGENKENWLLVKADDEFAESGREVVEAHPHSVLSGRSQDEVAAYGEWADRGGPPWGVARNMPEFLAPQLATLTDKPPSGSSWLHEIKFDGYRTLCRVHEGRVTLLSRNAKDWTRQFGAVAHAVQRLPIREGWLDGEVAVLQPDGTTSFQELQTALGERRDQDLVYFLFDLLYLDGTDLSAKPLRERKAALAALLESMGPGPSPLRYSDHIVGHGTDFFQQACKVSLEGIMSKRADRPYRPGRGREWLKLKCLQRQEFVVGGYTDPAGARRGFGALLLGIYEGERLCYVGRVGTGFNERTLADLCARLQRLESSRSPFATAVPRPGKAALHWARPSLVVEVAFANWTEDGVLRQPVFQGLREDKEPRDVMRERPAVSPPSAAEREPPMPAAQAVRSTVAGLRLSNPDKVLYPGQGVTKRDLANYYEAVAPYVLADITDRPLTLLRCPDGRARNCFFQKHADRATPKEILRIPIAEDGKRVIYLAVDSLAGLVGLVQMGVLEIHVWGARSDRPDTPDRIVLDLDPDIDLPWSDVLDGARAVRDVLEELGLAAFVRTTGGKGLHVVVPLRRRHGWAEVKAFAQAIAHAVVRSKPQAYTARLAKAARKRKIFIDYLRNSRGATAVGNYTTRAKWNAPVAVPLRWAELGEGLHSDHFTVGNVLERLKRVHEPWAGYEEAAHQSITKNMKRRLGLE